MKTRSRTFDQLLSAYPSGVQTLARQTRAFVLRLLPDAEQTVDASGPYVCYGYGPGYKGIVCTISVNKTGAKLALAQGATLPDPTGLLEGAGKVHRHVVIATAGDLQQPGLEPLVRAAYRAWQKRL
jgi:hypothetical protein